MTDKTNPSLSDAEHERRAWWHDINNALLAMDHAWGLPNNEATKSFGRWKKHQAVLDLLNKGLDLMRAPRAPRPSSESSYHVSLVADLRKGKAVGSEAAEAIIALEQSEARLEAQLAEAVASAEKPEPRPSSALAAAKALVDLKMYLGVAGSHQLVQEHADRRADLRKAIAAEEARGPSEVERLNNHIKSAETEFDVQLNAERLNSKQVEERAEKAEADCEQLRKERSEAIGRAKTAERERDEAWSRAEKAEAALAALSTPPQQNHTGDDNPLRKFLEKYDPDNVMATTSVQDQAALAELCRRALARGAK